MKHCIDVKDLNKAELLNLINLAEAMIHEPQAYAHLCQGRQLATLFYEPSTRTRLSFTSAMLALGGSVLGFSDEQSTSVSKGETVADTTRIISGYADIIAMRHYKEGAALAAALHSSIPVINAGDGSHSHPTQTLTDLLTIHRELGRLDHLTIGLCGDLKYGRTVHSLIKAMAQFEEINFVLIATDSLGLPKYMLKELEENPQLSYTIKHSLEEAIGSLDVLYMTRIQKERFENEQDYQRCKGSFILDQAVMELAKSSLRVLHPLPRVDEIATELDSDPRMAYFRQAHNGKFIRMALICFLLKLDVPNLLKPNAIEPTFKELYLKHNGEYKCSNKHCISTVEVLPKLIEKSNSEPSCPYCEKVLLKNPTSE